MSPSTGRPYPLTMICALYRVPHASLYLALAPPRDPSAHAAKRGPRTARSDAEVVAAIRAVLAATPFYGEG